MYLNMLQKFLMPIPKEEGPNDMLLEQDEASSHLHKEMMGFLNHKFSGPSLGHLVYLTLLLGVLQECCVCVTTGNHSEEMQPD